MRIVSVLPSATEIVCALGHGEELVGRSLECDYPPEVQRLPAVMWPRTIDADHTSAEIDERVRRVRGRGDSLYVLDIEALRALQPDLLLTQDLCGVCSVTSEEVTDACTRAGVAPRVLSLVPRTLEDVWRSFPTVAAALQDPEAGLRLEQAARTASAAARGTPGTAHRVAIVEWVDPPILAGLWDAEIVAAAGGVSVGPGKGEPSVRTTWKELAALAPDLVVISPCSFSVPRTERELSAPHVAEGVRRLSPALGVYLADEAYFSRPGPRLADGVRLVRSLLERRAVHDPLPVRRWEGRATPTVRS